MQISVLKKFIFTNISLYFSRQFNIFKTLMMASFFYLSKIQLKYRRQLTLRCL